MSRGEGGGAPINNKNGTALKDPDMRKRAYKSFCDHRAKGKAVKSWFFEEDNCSCTWETLYKYIKDDVEFDPLQLKAAEAKGYNYWESVVEASAVGTNKEANTASLQMLMRNKYGWDKDQKNSNSGITVRIDKDGIGSGINISSEAISNSNHQGSESGD